MKKDLIWSTNIKAFVPRRRGELQGRAVKKLSFSLNRCTRVAAHFPVSLSSSLAPQHSALATISFSRAWTREATTFLITRVQQHFPNLLLATFHTPITTSPSHSLNTLVHTSRVSVLLLILWFRCYQCIRARLTLHIFHTCMHGFVAAVAGSR